MMRCTECGVAGAPETRFSLWLGTNTQDRFPLCNDCFKQPRLEFDAVDHPAHYTTHPSGVECIQITEHLNFCLGNAVKYLWRADLKGGTEDLRKAIWYISREIDRLEGRRDNRG